MLKLLFNSEVRIKLLSLLLLHSDKAYSVQQLAKELSFSNTQINKELTNLAQFGLIMEAPNMTENNQDESKKVQDLKKNKKPSSKKTTPNKSLKFFIVNKNFILYPEIKSLFIKSQILSSQNFIINLEKNFQAKLLLLTGVFTNYLEAQTDLLIVGKINRPPFLKLIAELEKDLGREINFTIMDENEYEYRQEMMDIFLYNITEGEKIILINNLPEK